MKAPKLVAALTFALFLSGCSSQAPGHGHAKIWTASIENGDKPGIGLILTVADGLVTTGDYYLLDPEHPGDFKSAGLKAPLAEIQKRDSRISFTVNLAGHRIQQALLFSGPLSGTEVKATLLSPEEAEGMELVFRPEN